MQDFLQFLFHLDAESGCTLGGRTCVLGYRFKYKHKCRWNTDKMHSKIIGIGLHIRRTHMCALVCGFSASFPVSPPHPTSSGTNCKKYTYFPLRNIHIHWPKRSWRKPTADAPGERLFPPWAIVGREEGRRVPRTPLLALLLLLQELSSWPNNGQRKVGLGSHPLRSPPLMKFFFGWFLNFCFSI